MRGNGHGNKREVVCNGTFKSVTTLEEAKGEGEKISRNMSSSIHVTVPIERGIDKLPVEMQEFF